MDHEFDYIVVGGGSAGCVLANRLSADPAVRVALLEAGPDHQSAFFRVPLGAVAFIPRRNRYNWAFETIPQRGLGGRRGYQPRGRVLGGSSALNAMCYTRGHREDYDRWAREGAPGWAWADVLPYFKKSENQERGADAFHGVGGPLNVADLRSPNPFVERFVQAAREAGFPENRDFNGAEQEGVGPYQVTQKNGERYSTARAYLEPVRGRPNLAVYTGALVTRVRIEGGRAVGVDARTEAGPLALAARREVILAAGALQSPQILLLSGVGPGAALQSLGIGVTADVPGVGENLHDHIDYTLGCRSPERSLFGLSAGGAIDLLRDWREYARSHRGRFTTNFAEAGGFIKSAPGEAIPDLQLHVIVAMVDDHVRKLHAGHGMSCHVCVLRPKSRGTLRLASADPQAAPLVDPDFLGDPDDLERLLRGFKLVRRILSAPALASHRGREYYTEDVRTDDEIRAAIRARADTVYHPVGTCRMGTDALAVVDPQLRVRGLEGLRVIDCSIMPSIIGGNTNAPAVMIAEKGADLVLADRGAARLAA